MNDLIPRAGEPETAIDRLFEYAAPIDPGLSRRVRGADEDMIALYAKLAGFGADALPASYRAFSQFMGLDDGGLFQNFRIQARLPSLIKLYQECVQSEPDSINPDLPVVATYIVGDQISLDRSAEVPEPEVVETSDGELIAPLSLSWEHLLLQAAMLHIEARRLPHGRWFSILQNSAALALPLDATGKRSPVRVIDSFRRGAWTGACMAE